MTLAVDFDRKRAAERKTLADIQRHPRADAKGSQVLQGLSIAIYHSFHFKARTRCSLLQRVWPLLNVTVEICGRDRISVRVVGRVPENLVDALFEGSAHYVLEHLGMLVHLVPLESEDPVQEQLDKPMAPRHPDGDRFAVCRQLHLLAWISNNQIALLETLKHR